MGVRENGLHGGRSRMGKGGVGKDRERKGSVCFSITLFRTDRS